MKKSEKSGLPILNRKELDLVLTNWSAKPKKVGDRTKGFLIIGLPGVGKSTALKKICGVNNPYATVHDYHRWLSGGNSDSIKSFYWRNCLMALDEIGSSEKLHFGEDPVPGYIMDLYDKWSTGNTDHLTVFLSTTNLNLEQISELYGERVLDRLKQMCYIIVLEDTKIRPGIEDQSIEEEFQIKRNNLQDI